MTYFGYILNNRFLWCILLLWNHVLIAQTIAKPDLTPIYFKFTPFGINEVKGDIIIKNVGTAPSKPTTIAIIDNATRQLWSDKVLLPPLAVGESFTYVQAGFRVPETITPTIYPVRFVVDFDKLNDELVETDNITPLINISFGTTSPTPQPAAPKITLNTKNAAWTGNAGSVFSGVIEVGNYGTADATNVSIVGSYKRTQCPGASPCYSGNLQPFGVGTIKMNELKDHTVSFLLPTDIPVGTYSITLGANIGQSSTALATLIIEAPTPLVATLQPDLSISALKLGSASVVKNNALNFTFDVSNIGTASSPSAFSIKSYLSKDKLLSADDVQDGKVILGNLQANTGLGQVAGTLTARVPEGEYYLIVKVDADNQAIESNENNNIVVSALPITVVPILPDLTLATIKELPETVKIGATVPFKFDLKNIGQVPTPTAYRIGAYLSKDNLLNTNDVLVGTIPYAATGVGSVLTVQSTIKIPLSTMTGNYYLILVVDDLKNIVESNENNNILLKPLQIVQPEVATIIKDVSVSISTTPALYTQYEDITYKITVTNTGQQTMTNIVTNLDYIEIGKLPFTASKASIGTAYNMVTKIWSVGTLAAGQSATLDLVLFPMVKGEDLLLKATITPTDDKPENNIIINVISNAITVRSEPKSGFGIEVLYPNPVEDVLNLSLRGDTNGILQVYIFNTVGLVIQKTIQNTPKGADNLLLDVSELPEGMYILKLSDEKNRTVVRKFVK